MLDKMEVVDKPVELNAKMNIQLEPSVVSGNDVLTVTDLTKSFDGNTLFNNINFDIKRGERVALIGNNGTGKTTILKLINGIIQPDSGSIYLGAKVAIGYYDQEHHVLDPDKTLFQEIQDAYPDLNNTQIRNTLAAFLFTDDDVFKYIRDLSGGERGRVSLAKLMLSNANLLILDEPTNHLDLDAIAWLEEFLINFENTVIVVSHDRYFLDRVVDRIFAFEAGGHLTQYEGGYTDYRDKCVSSIYNVASNGVSDTSKSKAAGQVKKAYNSHEDKIKFTYMEQKEYETIDDDIEKLENRVSELDDEIAKNATSYSVSYTHLTLPTNSRV